jgi:outer membrane protein OmpA-like peptidoglycan-associated protein
MPRPDWVNNMRPERPDPTGGEAEPTPSTPKTQVPAQVPAPGYAPPYPPAYRPWGGRPHGGWGYPGYNRWGPGWGSGIAPGYGYGYNACRPSPPYYLAAAPAPARPAGPPDGDSDGVADASDLCPDTATGVAVDALGCDNAARIVLRGVNFKTDSDELTAESLAILDAVSATLSANPQIQVMVAGHTDGDGEDSYNKDLSQRRAQRVVDYLAGNGVERNNLIAKGFGEEQPIAGNDTVEGKAQNRRVELNRL